MNIYDSLEYADIMRHYGNEKAKRSQVPLMNHINEGLTILEYMGASESVLKAFCIHPLFQNNESFLENYGRIFDYDPRVMVNVLEYRNKANSYLCVSETDSYTESNIAHSVGTMLINTRAMLIADKIQNKKDFMVHHYGTHPRSEQLLNYFNNWLKYLEIGKFEKELTNLIL